MKRSIRIIAFTLSLLFTLSSFSFAGNGDETRPGDMSASKPKELSSYPVPEDKLQKWESLKNIAGKDYDVCLEHCGNEQSCFDKCEASYNYKISSDYKMLLNE